MLGPKGPTVAAEGCCPPQELEKAARRGAIFLVACKVDKNNCMICSRKVFLDTYSKNMLPGNPVADSLVTFIMPGVITYSYLDA